MSGFRKNLRKVSLTEILVPGGFLLNPRFSVESENPKSGFMLKNQ